MPDFPDIIGAAGLALAFVAFYLGFSRHRDNAKAEDRRHTEAMAKEDKRHTEAMAKEDNRHKEAMAKQDDNRRALEAIIQNTAPRPGPAG